MNREIKFRGISKDYFKKGEWVYGYLFIPKHVKIAYIVTETYYGMAGGGEPDFIEVIPESVGQFTGLKDKNKIEIYEKNKVRQEMASGETWVGEVVFEQGAFRIRELSTEDNPKIYLKDLIGGLAEIIG